jgi:YidC/Oxa1 family membrane protein insertase
MTNNIRVFLWLSLLLALWLNYSQWQIDYGPKPSLAGTTAADGTTDASKPASLEDSIPQADQTKPEAALPADGSVPVPTTETALPAPVESGGKIRVSTDVLVLDIDLKGGTLVYAALPGYPLVKGKPEPVVLFNLDGPNTNYILQSGLSGVKADDVRPTHLQTFASQATRYELGAGQDELRVPLTWTDGNGVTVTKTYVFHRSMYAVGIEYSIDNKSSTPWTVHSYARISRFDPKIESSMFTVKPENLAFRGPVIYDGKKYQKLDIEKSEHQQLTQQVTHGWIAGMQHHFVSVIVPNSERPYTYTLRAQGRQYLLGALGPPEVVAPNTTGTIKESIFVGPKLQKQLDSLHPELSRVADYGMLTLLSRPLFWLLEHAHSLVRNWGLAIILVTFLLKLLFYPLSEKSGRSMARMRALAPRMKILQETYKDDRTKLGQATMELYKTEKVNPLAGCLPMLIQMPVFLAFYWVLVESAEMRQAPFFGWINDLSSRDPFFILPVLNVLAMWGQSKLNPPPPDPVQARIFQFMPLVFGAMFAFFPAGLVLYWVTNTGLTILQQWNINRKIEAEDKARKK